MLWMLISLLFWMLILLMLLMLLMFWIPLMFLDAVNVVNPTHVLISILRMQDERDSVVIKDV